MDGEDHPELVRPDQRHQNLGSDVQLRIGGRTCRRARVLGDIAIHHDTSGKNVGEHALAKFLHPLDLSRHALDSGRRPVVAYENRACPLVVLRVENANGA